MPGPKGYIHGWIYVGGPGLPAPGSEHAPKTPSWKPGQGTHEQPIGAGWARGPSALAEAKADFPPGTRVRLGPQRGKVREVQMGARTNKPVVVWDAVDQQGKVIAGPYAHPPERLAHDTNQGVPSITQRRDPNRPAGAQSTRGSGPGGWSYTTPETAPSGIATPRTHEIRPQSTQQLADAQLARESAPTSSVPRTRVTNKAQAAERADKMVAAHGGDASAAIQTLDRTTPNEKQGTKDFRLTRQALHERTFSQHSAQLRQTPAYQQAISRPAPTPPGVGTPEDFTNRNTGTTRLGVGHMVQTPQGTGRIVASGGTGANEKLSVELADGRTVVVSRSQLSPVEPKKGQRAEWIGSGIRGKVVDTTGDTVTIEHQELGNKVRKTFRKSEVTVTPSKAGSGRPAPSTPESTTPTGGLTRKTAKRGSTVRVTLKDGTTVGGKLTAWGSQIIELALDPESKRKMGRNWKRDSFSTTQIAKVEPGGLTRVR